jgi:IclR family transcriptional regulator, pca regulon regulatory protein
MNTIKNPRDDGEYITSLARGLSVLRTFSKQRPEMTLSEVASACDLSPAVVRRCLNTLMHLGYIGKNGKLFLLRPEVMTIASAYLESMNLEEVVQPHLQKLRDEVGDSSSLSVLLDDEILYLIHVSTNRMIRLNAGVGTRFPIYATSMGRVLMAYQEKEIRENYLKRGKFVAYTDKTVTSAKKLRTIFNKVRKEGYVTVQDELDYGIVSISVPILNECNEVVAAINCSTSTARVTQENMVKTRLPKLINVAKNIEMELRRYPILSHSVAR